MDKLKLNRIRYSASLSQETYAFTANLCLNGKKVAECENNGFGGSTNVHVVSKSVEEVLLSYVASLPVPEAWKFQQSLSLCDVVDILMHEWVMDKEFRRVSHRFENDMLKGLCYNESGNHRDGYSTLSWGRFPLSVVVERNSGVVLEVAVSKVREGFKILNTNIPQGLLDALAAV